MSSAAVPPSAVARPAIVVVGTGAYVPEKVLTNADLERMVETSDEWIMARTGIRERRICAEGEITSDMAAAAARAALADAGVPAAEVDLILIATATPDMFFPSTGCVVQAKLGVPRGAACMDLSAACSGFLYALEVGRQMLAGGAWRTALVIGVDKLSAVVDWTDRNTCVLFGDGAGAAVLRRADDPAVLSPSRGILSSVMGCDGTLGHILNMPGGGTRCPITRENVDSRINTLKMNGKETFRQAIVAMTNSANEALVKAGITADDVACIIPHQANLRIIEAIADRMKIGIDRFVVNLDRYGNTSAAAVAIALDEAHRNGRLKRGDKVLMVVFGSGLTWAATVVEW